MVSVIKLIMLYIWTMMSYHPHILFIPKTGFVHNYFLKVLITYDLASTPYHLVKWFYDVCTRCSSYVKFVREFHYRQMGLVVHLSLSWVIQQNDHITFNYWVNTSLTSNDAVTPKHAYVNSSLFRWFKMLQELCASDAMKLSTLV